MPLDLAADVLDLTRALCDLESVSGNETELADEVAAALAAQPHLEVLRDGDAVVARTTLGRPGRVVVAGHLDTVPVAGNLPTRLVGDELYGRGTVDMKGGVATMLRAAVEVPDPVHDVTWVFYDNEEVEAAKNGLGRLARTHPEWLAGEFAVLCEPTAGAVEGGCNGTLRVTVTLHGTAAHSARAWLGRNAVHAAGEVLDRLRRYEAATVDVDGLAYRESLQAVGITGGIAGNVVPDRCVVTVNYRFAPDKDAVGAEAHVRDLLAGFEVEVVDAADGARPGLHHPAAAAFVAATGRPAGPKYGWTDVARFSALGVPAVNYGPGDPSLAHHDAERVPVAQLHECEQGLISWLRGG